jgi:hypothetical protein
VTAWCGVPENETRQAISALRGQNVIDKVDEIPNGNKKATFLYPPGQEPAPGRRGG